MFVTRFILQFGFLVFIKIHREVHWDFGLGCLLIGLSRKSTHQGWFLSCHRPALLTERLMLCVFLLCLFASQIFLEAFCSTEYQSLLILSICLKRCPWANERQKNTTKWLRHQSQILSRVTQKIKSFTIYGQLGEHLAMIFFKKKQQKSWNVYCNSY